MGTRFLLCISSLNIMKLLYLAMLVVIVLSISANWTHAEPSDERKLDPKKVAALTEKEAREECSKAFVACKYSGNQGMSQELDAWTDYGYIAPTHTADPDRWGISLDKCSYVYGLCTSAVW